MGFSKTHKYVCGLAFCLHKAGVFTEILLTNSDLCFGNTDVTAKKKAGSLNDKNVSKLLQARQLHVLCEALWSKVQLCSSL